MNRALFSYGYVGDLSFSDGRYFPSKAPLLSFAAVPVYAAVKMFASVGEASTSLNPNGESPARPAPAERPLVLALVYFARLFLTVLPTLALLVMLQRFLRAYVSDAVADVVTATYAVGSLAFSYSLLFMSHQATAVLLFAAFYLLWRSARGELSAARAELGAGLLAGAAVAAEYTSVLGVLAVAVYGLWVRFGPSREGRSKRLARLCARVAAGAVLPVGFLLWYHQVCFGHPLSSGYQHLADQAYQPWHQGGFLGIRLPDPRAAALSFSSPLRGLFALSPFLLLGVAGLFAEKVRRGEHALFWMSTSALLTYGYFTSSFSYESWGWTTGPRHLTGLVPFLLFPVAMALERAGGWWRGIAAGLCAASVVVTGLLSLLNYIPDQVSSALFGLFLPLVRDGFYPPSVLALVDGPPWSGLALIVAVLAVALLCIARLAQSSRQWIAALATVAVALGGHRLGTTHAPGDLGAVAHLKSAWLEAARR